MAKSLALSLVNVYETLAISWPTVLDAALGRVTKQTCDDRLASWSRKVVKHLSIDLEVTGRDHMRSGVTYLVMSNHQSHYDIPVLFSVVGPNIRMVAKKELFRVPVFGPAIHEAGFISIDRSNRRAAIESLRAARETLARGVHVWIAPEGTRSKTGKLLPFKKGGFNLALDAGLSILPVTIQGTRNILPSGSARSARGEHVRVAIHAPVDAKQFGSAAPGAAGGAHKQARDRLMAEVRGAIERGL